MITKQGKVPCGPQVVHVLFGDQYGITIAMGLLLLVPILSLIYVRRLIYGMYYIYYIWHRLYSNIIIMHIKFWFKYRTAENFAEQKFHLTHLPYCISGTHNNFLPMR